MRRAEYIESNDPRLRDVFVNSNIIEAEKTTQTLHLCATNLAEGRELYDGCPVIHEVSDTGIR